MFTREWPLLPVYATTVVFFVFDAALLGGLDSALWLAFVLGWLFAVMLAAAFAVVRHSDCLAEIFGEPYGTLILTLAITVIEVMMIAAVMLTGPQESTLARDTMFAVVMIVFNGMAGLSAAGGRPALPRADLQPAGRELLPRRDFAARRARPGAAQLHVRAGRNALHAARGIPDADVVGAVRHIRGDPDAAPPPLLRRPRKSSRRGTAPRWTCVPAAYHGALLLAYIVPIVLLSKKIAVPIDHAIGVLGAPAALAGFLVAALILAPESLAAVRAALANQLQRAINLLLGSVLASISLTIPAVLAIGLLTDRTVVLGLEPVDVILLVLTLGMSTLTFGSGRTNILLGAVHLLLFFSYLILIFER